jgi:predicted hotdog family 3-hydroxylacyl-ACP dehydratase
MTSRKPDAEAPPVAELLPHDGTMVFLSRLLRHAEDETVCLVEIDDQTHFRGPDGAVPAWVGLEYMAQCVAAHAGMAGRVKGEPPQLGMLLGSRRVQLHAARFAPGQTLRVSARHVWGSAPGLVSFECTLEDADSGARLAEGRLGCFVPGDDHAWGES